MTHITDEHRRAFEALTSGVHDNFALFSCFVGGSPAAAIVAVNRFPPAEEGAEPEYVVSPRLIIQHPRRFAPTGDHFDRNR